MDENKDQIEKAATVDLASKFWEMCIIFLMRKYIMTEGSAEVEELIKIWKNTIEENIAKELEAHKKIEDTVYMKILMDAGLPYPKTSELHQKADNVMYDAESLIREFLDLKDQDNLGIDNDDIPF